RSDWRLCAGLHAGSKPRAADVRPEGGARCVSSARRDLRGGRSAMSVPTATHFNPNYSSGDIGMIDTTTASQLMSSQRLRAAIFASIPLIFCRASYVSSQAFTIDKESFQASTKDFSACKIKASSSFSQKAINVARGELELGVVQLDDRLYCIHLLDTKTLNT